MNEKIAVIGAGNIGISIINGLVKSGKYTKEQIYLTRRHLNNLEQYGKKGFHITTNNNAAVRNSKIVLLCVEPQQAVDVLKEISKELHSGHILISVVSSLTITKIYEFISSDIKVIRAMPNTAISIGESITCLASIKRPSKSLDIAMSIFSQVGEAIVINEEQMSAATALGACGIAFFMRAIRAASQGGIEIGFHSEDALKIAAQTAKGAASLLGTYQKHPEHEIDKVTTPRGCTISGLNQMEHDGFSSAMIKGIVISAEKAEGLIKE